MVYARELIDTGKRVIVFLDAGAGDGGVDFILPQFDMIWEPPFSESDPKFPCRKDRISGPLSPVDHMYMLNHNLNTEVIDGVLIANRPDAPTTNSVNSIIANANGCRGLANGLSQHFHVGFRRRGRGVESGRPDEWVLNGTDSVYYQD